MVDLHEFDQPGSDIEALVRAAGDYVHVTEDLRPRVLESAQARHREQRARRMIRRFAACVALVTAATPTVSGTGSEARQGRQLAWSLPEPAAATAESDAEASVGRDSLWRLVDAYTELRRRQSAAIGAAL